MEAINYANGFNMTLPADTQIVQGVSGNAVYLPAGAGTMPIAGNRNELTISLWRQWDGVVDSAAYRGIFEIANIKVYFDQATDFLTIELADTKTVTDVKDDQEQAHWCFLFSKNSFFKIYKNAELKAELTVGNYPADFSEGFTLGGGRTHATFDEVRMYKTVVTESEIRGLYSLVTKGTQVKQLENIVASVTPKYLGMVETVPDTRTAIIRQGEKLGAVDANPGDWVLSGKTIGGWKVGVCYRWTGVQWLNLQPEVNYAKEYQACLVHLFEIEELKQQTGHFGALFAKVLVAQEAFVEKLVAQEAFIKKLSGDIAFLNRLIVKKLHIDTDDTTHQDFEAWFDELNGLKIRNKGEEIFRVDKNGDVFAKNVTMSNGDFEGNFSNGAFFAGFDNVVINIYYLTTGKTRREIQELLGFASIPSETKTIQARGTINGTTYTSFTAFAYHSTSRKIISEEGDDYIKITFSNGISYTLDDYAGGVTAGVFKSIPETYSTTAKTYQDNTNTIRFKGLPTNKPDENGIVWSDGGTLKIS